MASIFAAAVAFCFPFYNMQKQIFFVTFVLLLYYANLFVSFNLKTKAFVLFSVVVAVNVYGAQFSYILCY